MCEDTMEIIEVKDHYCFDMCLDDNDGDDDDDDENKRRMCQ